MNIGEKLRQIRKETEDTSADYMRIGAKIRALRRARKLSRKATARAAGTFSMDSLRRWEIGEQSPRVDELEQLAEVLGVPVGEVLG